MANYSVNYDCRGAKWTIKEMSANPLLHTRWSLWPFFWSIFLNWRRQNASNVRFLFLWSLDAIGTTHFPKVGANIHAKDSNLGSVFALRDVFYFAFWSFVESISQLRYSHSKVMVVKRIVCPLTVASLVVIPPTTKSRRHESWGYVGPPFKVSCSSWAFIESCLDERPQHHWEVSI